MGADRALSGPSEDGNLDDSIVAKTGRVLPGGAGRAASTSANAIARPVFSVKPGFVTKPAFSLTPQRVPGILPGLQAPSQVVQPDQLGQQRGETVIAHWNLKSRGRRVKTDEKARLRNRAWRNRYKNAYKRLQLQAARDIEKGNVSGRLNRLGRKYMSLLDKNLAHGVITKGKNARLKSRLSRILAFPYWQEKKKESIHLGKIKRQKVLTPESRAAKEAKAAELAAEHKARTQKQKAPA